MRPKGTPNKVSSTVRQNIIGVFDKIGGRDKMAEWALANLSEFYRLYCKLLPTVVVADVTVRDTTDLSDSELADIARSGSPRALIEAASQEQSPELH